MLAADGYVRRRVSGCGVAPGSGPGGTESLNQSRVEIPNIRLVIMGCGAAVDGS